MSGPGIIINISQVVQGVISTLFGQNLNTGITSMQSKEN